MRAAKTELPSVCVTIPVYNGMPHLRTAIASALGQDYPELSVIVVDNSSKDGTKEFLESLCDPRLRVLYFEEHVSVAESWDRAIQHAEGDYFLILSADNVLQDGAIGQLVEAVMQDNYDFAYGQAAILNQMPESQTDYNPLRLPRVGVIEDIEADVLRRGFTVAIDSFLFKRGMPGLYMRADTRNACDLDLILRLGQDSARGIGIAQDVIERRRHEGMLSHDRSKLWDATLMTLAEHMAASERPALYQLRIIRVLVWAIVDAMDRNADSEARSYFVKYGKMLRPSDRMLLFALQKSSIARQLLSAIRKWRLALSTQ